MKKLLLIAALGMTLSASAGSASDYFKVTQNGETLESGATVYACEQHGTFNETIGFAEKMVPILTNILSTSYKTQIVLYAVDPSYENYDQVKDGTVQLCPSRGFINTCFLPSEGNLADYTFDFPEKQFVDLDVHLSYTDAYEGNPIPKDLLIKTKLVITVVDDPEAEFVLYIDLSGNPNYGAGVDAMAADNAQAVYYNMQGVRVNNPEKGGLYIVRQGSKTTKQIIK